MFLFADVYIILT